MAATQPPNTQSPEETSGCIARSVANALAEDPTLEAVTINRARQTISVATLGRTDEARLSERITRSIENAQNASETTSCALLSGTGDCQTCDSPLSADELHRITIKREGDQTTIARVTCPTAPKFWRWRVLPFPKVVQRDVGFFEHADHADEWKAQLVAALLCGVFGLSGYFVQHPAISTGCYILAYLAGGWFTLEEVWERLREWSIDVHFLMLAVAVGSASIGAWGEGSMLLFLFSFSGALEHYALGRTQKEIRSLFREAPKSATVLDDHGHESEVPLDQLRTGMRLLAKPGAQFPVDAEIVKGKTASDESNLTGEATPVDKNVGDTVLAGTMNLWGAAEIVVLRPVRESALQKIIHLIKEAQQQKAPAQQFTDKFSAVYTYSILALSLVMFFVWWLVYKLPPFSAVITSQTAFYRTMTLLVVASPCALVLSIPSAVLAAIAWSARHGILFRGGAAVEKLADARIVALDKTGTLTTGELRVERVESFPPGREEEIARLACSLERLSTHPLARAIVRHGKQRAIQSVEFDEFESITGQGVQGRRGSTLCQLGKRDWLVNARHVQATANVLPTEPGFSEVWVVEGDLIGRILLRDDIRPQAREVIDQLRRDGLKTVVLTGDRRATAENLKNHLHLDEIRSELKPEQKVAAIRELSADGNKVVMIGDGVNDAPSLAAAHIGIAMGARGADAALEQADVVLMHDKLENFHAAYRLSQRARRIIRQNLFISLATVVVLVYFAMMGQIPLTLGVVGHEGSTVIVVMNSLRLLLAGSKKPFSTETSA
jgi:Cd2+/Zn2+-exporting ATPase